MNSLRYLIVSILFILTTSCKEEVKTTKIAKKPFTIVPVESPAGIHSSLPFLFSNEEQTLLSWVEKEGDSLTTLKYAELLEGSWQNPKEIVQGTDWFVNWADYPMIAANRGNLWSHVLKKSSVGTYSYDVKMNLLQKGDSLWKTDVALHTDNTPTEHGFVTPLPYKKGFFVNWLDGRNTEEREGEERGAMTLRAAEVSVSGEVTAEHELDVRTCDCCQTTAAITANGPVVIYRDRSDTEVRDISIVRQVAGKWTKPKTVYKDNWKIKGCPVNGPKAAAIGNNLAVAWFTGAQQNARIQIAFSQDGGAIFSKPITIAEGAVLGRVDVVLLNKRTAVVSWMETEDKVTTLKVLKVARSGLRSRKIPIATMSASRKSGFPQMELVGDILYFAWTDFTKKETQVKTALIKTADL